MLFDSIIILKINIYYNTLNKKKKKNYLGNLINYSQVSQVLDHKFNYDVGIFQ